MNPAPSRNALERLAWKYRTLAALRARREELERQGRPGLAPEELPARRAAFQEVAGEFPGALRELDGTSAVELAARARAVEEALEDPARAPAWIVVVLDYHATLRELLALKLRLARRIGRDGEITEEVLAEVQRWHAGWPHGSSARPIDRALLERLHHPPRGRVQPLVWEELSTRHGLPRAALERAVFGGDGA